MTTASAARKSRRTPRPAAPVPARASRPLVMGAALVGALGLTAGLLAWASPAPLSPDAVGRLFVAAEAPRPGAGALEAAFETRAAIRPGRWQYVYVHQSKTPGGDAATLAGAAAAWGVAGPADHFVIGNGLGAGDGEIQFTPRWDEQQPAAPPAAGATVHPACVSICLVGDLDRAPPTAAQVRRLGELLDALEGRLGLGRDRLVVVRDSPTAAGVGGSFPVLP